MRPVLYALAAMALAAIVPPSLGSSMLASCASVLVEVLPFLALGSVGAIFGCGCGRAGARALPVVALAWMTFGPAVAIARFAAAVISARLYAGAHVHERAASPLDELKALIPSALLASVVLHAANALGIPQSPASQIAVGIALGFAGAPCALGGVALASAFHMHAPLAASATLCISGIVDMRTLLPRTARTPSHNGFAYALLALVCGIVAAERGAHLVHPIFTLPLVATAVVFAWRATREKWIAPRWESLSAIIALAALVVATPVPDYGATETTLANAFPGERVEFMGVLVIHGSEAALVRYAITCCRADAEPVVLRLASAPAFPERTWLSVKGTLARTRESLSLVPTSIVAVAPPTDPFVYR